MENCASSSSGYASFCLLKDLKQNNLWGKALLYQKCRLMAIGNMYRRFVTQLFGWGKLVTLLWTLKKFSYQIYSCIKVHNSSLK